MFLSLQFPCGKVGNGRTRGNRTDGVPVWGLAAWKPLGKVWVFSFRINLVLRAEILTFACEVHGRGSR